MSFKIIDTDFADGGGTTVNGILTSSLALSAATLVGGTELVAASGVLPQRVTTERVYWLAPEYGNVVSAIFGNDNRSVIICTANAAKKFDFTGSLIWTHGTTVRGLWRVGPNLITYGHTAAGATVTFVTESTGLGNNRVKPNPGVAHRQIIQVPGGTADMFWTGAGGTGSDEFSLVSGLTTGRKIITPAGVNAMWAVSGTWDNTPSLYLQFTSGTDAWVVRYRESDLVEVGRWVYIQGIARSGPGAIIGSEMWVDEASGSIYTRNTDVGFDVVPTAASASATVQSLATRALWNSYENFGASMQVAGGGLQGLPSFVVSSDGRYLCYPGPNRAMSAPAQSVFIRNIQPQRATWTWAMPSGTLQRIVVTGHFGNHLGYNYGSGSTNSNTAIDYRKTRCYYTRAGAGGDVSRVEFVAGEPIGVSLVSGSDLTIDVELWEMLGDPQGPRPYVSTVEVQYRPPA